MTDPRHESARVMFERGYTYAEIGERMGVTGRTVRRWLDPEYAENDRALSRAAKERRPRGSCAECGKRLHFDNASGLCHEHHNKSQRRWTAEAVIVAIQEWAAAHDGVPPSAADWVRSGPGHPVSSNAIRGEHRSMQGNPFDTWNDAIRAAGFEPRKSGLRKGYVSRTP